MRAAGLNEIFSTLSSVRTLLTAYAEQVASLNEEYRLLSSELESTFAESKGYWETTTAEKSEAFIHSMKSTLGRIDGIANGLDVIAAQLGQVDSSYAKRRETLAMMTVPSVSAATAEAYLSRMEAIAHEAKQIASECSLTVKAEPIQEIAMLFSNKRKEKYERLSALIAEGKAIREKAGQTLRSSVQTQIASLEEKKTLEIDKAANETADLLAQLEQKKSGEIDSVTSSVSSHLESLLPRETIELIRSLSDDLSTQEKLPSSFSEFVRLGSYEIPLGDIVYTSEAVSLVNYYYHGYIDGQNLVLPAILDLRDRANFMFFETSESSFVRATIAGVIYSLLQSQPASQQRFVFYDPEGRSQGFAPFLDFMRTYPVVMSDKVLTTPQQLREQIESLSAFIDEFSQTKLASNSDIFAYNRISPDRPEALKCLCLLNFPRGFDEQMLEQLYNIAKNGSSCGVQTIIHFDESSIRSSPGANYLECLSKIRECCISLVARHDSWYSSEGVRWLFANTPTQGTIAEFSAFFGEKYAEATSTILPISKILPRDYWFTNNSSSYFSVPIGKDENGEVQYLQFGDPISKGTSHHALVTGSLGSGKSTLLHTIIMSTLASYSPEEVNLYLLDFKSGTEFQIYANYTIPHIKVIALDAMQEFGQSVLDELVSMMQARLDLFTEEAKKGNPVKDINSYRRYTGKKMPRILVVADEFQVLFSEAHNRRVANTCATRLADIISLYRVCGIHFVLATQTMSRLRNGFTVSPSTLSEMHVRIGLKCSESECSMLFGEANSKIAFGKMGDAKGTAVYDENYVMEKPVGFKVAFCDTETQSSMLQAIADQFESLETATPTKVFVGDTVPKLSECVDYYKVDPIEAFNDVPIYLGEPIRIDHPVTLHVNKRKRSTLLVVGSDRRMTDQITAVYIQNAVKCAPRKTSTISDPTVYVIDGLSMMGEPHSERVGRVISGATSGIRCANDVFDVLPLIDEVYSIYEARKHARISAGEHRGQEPIIHVIISDFQWIEPISRMLNNKPVDDFSLAPEPSQPATQSELFGYVEKPKGNDVGGILDGFLAELTPAANQANSNVSYHKKLMTLLESGYTYGINVFMSCPDFISIKEITYECIPKFQNKILFALSDKDADRIISEARVESLKSNIALFYDGINPAYQFKPYDII